LSRQGCKGWKWAREEEVRPPKLILHTIFKIIFVGRIILVVNCVTVLPNFSIIVSLLLCGQYSVEGGGG
jgi:hypothetical protein